MKVLLRTFRFLKPYIWKSLIALLAMGLATALNLVTPALSRKVIDQGIATGDTRRILWLSLAVVAVALLRALFSFEQGALSAQVSQGVAYDTRNLLYEKIHRLSFSYHDRAQTGQLLTRVTSDVDLLQSFLGTAVLQTLSALGMLLGSVILIIHASTQTALILAVLLPVAIGLFGWFFRTAKPLFIKGQQKLEKLNIALQENLAGVRVVRAFVRRDYETARFAERNRAVMDIQVQVGRLLAGAMPLIFLIANFSTLGVTWVGGIQVINQQLTLGELVALSNYILMAIFPVFMLSGMMVSIAQASAGAGRIFEILDTPLAVTEKPDALEVQLEGAVSFEHVWFRYFENQPWILKDVTFSAAPGQKVALLGLTGSGKSTITNLIPRFYDVTKGRVLVDGHDVRDLRLESLRRQVGIVLQETRLFVGSIRENIAFGKPQATMEEIVAAAKAAQAHEFIMSFPDQYETHVGERGVTLSGGQKQRIAIARALLIDPRILILDDATSSVDFQTEQLLRQALNRLMHGRTSFIIAQRVSTVRDADLILVVDRGEISALGTHQQLLEDSPLYAELYYTQLEEDVEGHTTLFRDDVTQVKEVAR